MNYRIMTNVISITKQRYIKNSQKNIDSSFEELASSCAVSNTENETINTNMNERLRTKICELQWTQRDANDGINTIQITRNGLNDLQNTMSRLGASSGISEEDTLNLMAMIRSNLDTLHYHLNTTINNISVMVENLNAANSRTLKSIKNDNVQMPCSLPPFCEHPHAS